MSKIELRSIYKSYGSEKVIENLDLSIKEGSFTILLGPSGCGKSTILRMIAGLEKENAGDIFIDGKNMKNVEPGDRNISMVFQNYALYPTMTVRENIEFGLKNHKIPKEERNRRINEIVEMVGLQEYINKKPQFLSGGQRQRVALARAIVKKPQVFLMDEPLSNLDAKLRSQLRGDLIDLQKKLGTTFVYVTHDQVEAMSMGMDIVLLKKGQIQQQASPYDIYLQPRNIFTATFLGTPPMNVIPFSNIEDKAIKTIHKAARYVGFRPENAGITKQGSLIPKECLVLQGKLAIHEMLGSEVLYRVNCGNDTVNVKLFQDKQIASGEVEVYVNYNKLYYFDGQGNRIFEELDSKELQSEQEANIC